MNNTGNGIILIILALLFGYLAITGKYKCFTAFLSCVNGNEDNNTQVNLSSLPVLPLLGDFAS